jgi:hypothetical protein
MKIVICSSASFYQHALEIKDKLGELGHEAIVPATARKMQASGNFDVDHYKTWFGDRHDYHKKTALMRGHFDEVAAGDAILVLNDEKHGVQGYIGGNVLMEMAVAFHLKKPIYVLNSLPEDSLFEEEIIGLEPIVLGGDLSKL